jgi:hypothetical protein
MDIELLKKHFAGIGARVKVGEARGANWRNDSGINIRADSRGEYFDIRVDAMTPRDYRVIDLRPEERHLLLLSDGDSAKFLCGFDERHWFVSAVPGRGGDQRTYGNGSAATGRSALGRRAMGQAHQESPASPQRSVRAPGRVVLHP